VTRTVAVIQARTGSTRLPGKVLLPLGGTTVLEHVLARVGRAPVDAAVVATTTLADDDPIVAMAAAHDWPVVRGSEVDLLERYLDAAREHDADIVVRITSDCPLVDPEVIGDVIATRERERADYASNSLEPRTFPRGLDVEVVTREALERAGREDQDPASREHATPYIYRHPEAFRLAGLWLPTDLSHHRWTLDTPEDYALIERIYGGFADDTFAWREALALVAMHPEWSALNRDVPQKVVPGG